MSDRQLFLFTKPAVPGRVKTRLIGDLTPEQAALLHEAFLGDVLDRMRRGRFDLRVAWALEPHERPPFEDPPGLRQVGEDLGERLYRALSEGAGPEARVAAMGSDHPRVTIEVVEEAFERLDRGAEIVLGPATDGGYYLIASRAEALHQDLFAGIRWSTETVLQETLDRCQRRGLRVDLLPAGDDVDTPEDLARLAASLGPDDGCPRTFDLLARWGRLPRIDTRDDGGTGGSP